MAHIPSAEQQQRLVHQLKAEVAPVVQKHASLRHFCNEHTYVRYLRARGWDLAKAAKMLHATLQWRLEYKPHLIRWKDVEPESVTGKQMIYPVTTKDGKPIVLMRPRFENTKEPERQIKFLIYNLEVASCLADKSGVGKMCWLLDFEGYSYSNAPPIKVSIHCNNILQNHYPERLGLAVCYHSPTLFSMTWRAVSPFIDPVTKAKINFVDKGKHEREMMDKMFFMDQMEACIGGGLQGYAFNLEQYKQRMLQYDAELQAELAQAEQMADGQTPQTSADGMPAVAHGTTATTSTTTPTTLATSAGPAAVHGTAHGTANGVAPHVANGTAHGVANGLSHDAPNGVAHNGVTNGHVVHSSILH